MEKFSRVLVCLPPIDSVVKGVENYLSKNLEVLPEFIDTPGLLGFAIAWPTWSFSGILGFMKRVQDKYNCPVLEYIDEDKFEFLDLKKNKDYEEL